MKSFSGFKLEHVKTINLEKGAGEMLFFFLVLRKKTVDLELYLQVHHSNSGDKNVS